MPKISVIIPIYNSEKYLEKCLYSVMNQSFTDIEIVCIDDCSTDRSAEIVRHHKSQDNRINLIQNQIQSGCGGARNVGIRHARSNYISFVDSDDQIHPLMLQKLFESTMNCKFDVVASGFSRVDSNGKILSQVAYKYSSLSNNSEINIFRSTNIELWNKLWRKSLFFDNNIEFPYNTYYDDAVTTPRLLYFCQNLRTIEDGLYFHKVREGGESFSTSAKHLVDYFKVYDVLYDFLWQENLLERYSEEMLAYIDRTLNYHARSGISKLQDDDVQLQALKHLLIFKIGYNENREKVAGMNKRQILKCLASGHSSVRYGGDIKRKSRIAKWFSSIQKISR